MSDEVKTETTEIPAVEIKSDDDMFKFAMDELRKSNVLEPEQKEEVAEIETKEDQSVVEEKNGESAEPPKDEPQAEPKAEETKPTPDTAKPESKPHYTLEEIKELAKTGDFSQFDSSRLTPGELAAVKSMQAGLTPKLQEAAELRKERDTLIQRIRAEEEYKAKAEAEKKYQEEKEQYGEEMANLFKKVRDLEAANETAKVERERERMAFQAEQQKVMAQQFHYTFIEKAKEYGIPNNSQWEEMVMARVLAENQARSINNEPFISVEDGMRLVSETVGLSDADRLKNLLLANPKLKEALKNEFGQEAAKEKPKGPTVIKSSSSGGSAKSEIKPSGAEIKNPLLDNPNANLDEFAIKHALDLLKSQNFQ